jgi:hypothetical protein
VPEERRQDQDRAHRHDRGVGINEIPASQIVRHKHARPDYPVGHCASGHQNGPYGRPETTSRRGSAEANAVTGDWPCRHASWRAIALGAPPRERQVLLRM